MRRPTRVRLGRGGRRVFRCLSEWALAPFAVATLFLTVPVFQLFSIDGSLVVAAALAVGTAIVMAGTGIVIGHWGRAGLDSR